MKTSRTSRIEPLERRELLAVTYGTRFPVGPKPQPAIPAAAVVVSTRQSLAALIQQKPAGTAFVLTAGVHYESSISPLAGDQIWGQPGAILDGRGVAPYAFISNGGRNVLIANLLVRNYATPYNMFSIEAADTPAWTVQDCEVYGSTAGGIRGNGVVQRCLVHGCNQCGIACYYATGAVFQDNEVYGNNLPSQNVNGDGGGIESWASNATTIQYNYVHDNAGCQIHYDYSNINSVTQNNAIFGGTGQKWVFSICEEIGFKALIKNNWIEGNKTPTTIAGGAIGLISNADAEITGNVIPRNVSGIVIAGEDTPTGLYGQCAQRNAWVHGNTLVDNDYHVRMVNWGSDPYAQNNRLDANSYFTSGAAGSHWEWRNARKTWAQWQALGEDLNGVYLIV